MSANKTERYATILYIIKKITEKGKHTRKSAIQALTYLLQEGYEIPLGYQFRMGTFGILSPGLLFDLESMIDSDVITLSTVDKGFNYAFGPNGNPAAAAGKEFIKAHKDTLDKGLDAYAGRWSPEVSEAAALLFYEKEADSSSSVDEIIGKVKELFPKEKEEKLSELYVELVNNGIAVEEE